ncbi:hypothetical protein SADUNF_Sadunf08G0092500 [Salix dunnii]|uniref:Uncharacterized protein n=1 Tax=Salix dunnii TaxID=1413687 RepID=A0A835JXM0_9ROSI|nr:hypothetical protein SADUNF_Sadunf08G0092500 [Salix dunnii]
MGQREKDKIAILMELSQALRCTKECSGTSGSESGWTTYIASPIKENNSDDDSENKQGDCRKGNYESDDSMASDASSGPSHPELPCRINEGSINIDPFKHATATYLSKEKLHRQVKRGDGTRTTSEKEVSVLKASRAASHDHVQSGTKKCSNFLCADVLLMSLSKGYSMLRNFVREFQNSTVKLVSLPPSLPLPFSWKGELRLLEM